MSEIVQEIKRPNREIPDDPWGGVSGYTNVGGKRVKRRDFLDYVRSTKYATVKHSDGNLFLSGLGEWDCSRGGHKRSNTQKPFCMNCWIDL